MYFDVFSVILNCLLLRGVAGQQPQQLTRFPRYFNFGTATSAYQIEGAWNVSGKGVSMWDTAVHNFPSRIADGSNGDDAAQSYYRWEEDIAILRQLRVNFYRFSLSWTRLFPQGTLNSLNPDGVRYYDQLINGLLAAGIAPMVTIFHWDTPQRLQDLGGWTNDLIVNYYVEYANRVFQLFGDRVRLWITINEPGQYCQFGYDNLLAPFINSSGLGTYQCGHNVLRAHARAYRLYDTFYRSSQNGRVGIVIDTTWYEPSDSNSEMDREAADRALQFEFGWFINPIYSTEGDYPAAMRARVDYVSQQQGFPESRLPRFTPQEILLIRGSYDFMGVNHYSTFLARPDNQAISRIPSLANDIDVQEFVDPSWELSEGQIYFAVVPWGIRRLLNWISNTYGNDIEIFITENGYDGYRNESLVDSRRVNYLNSYLQEVLNAINDGVRVTAYTFWALMDNFEWVNGYNSRFGLFRIDYDDPTGNRTRVAKQSAMVYQNIIVTREVNESFAPSDFPYDAI